MSPDAFTPARLSARTQGAGDLVVCLHSSAGTHAQWQGLAQALSSRWQVLAPDLHGHGRSPQWPETAANSLNVDGHAVTALMEAASPHLDQRGVHLVGHSYGGAVALQIALRHPRAQHCELEGAGHLGPMTHEVTVTQWMATYLDPSLTTGLHRVAMAA